MTFTTGQTLTAAVLNSNPTTFSGCFNNIDAVNIGAVGLYASNLNPTNATQATFGSGQSYTFANGLTVTGAFNASIYASEINPTTGAQATFGGSQLFTFPNGVAAGGPVSGTTGTFSGALGGGATTVTSLTSSGPVSGTNGSFSGTLGAGATTVGSLASSGAVSGTTGTFSGGVSGTTGTFSGAETNAGLTSTGAVKQTVGGTTYTIPYVAQSTSGSTNTHIEHGIVTTGTFSAGFACAPSTTFAKAFSGNPTIVGTLASGAGAASGLSVYVGSASSTAMTLCAGESGGSGAGPSINWVAVGE
jgi:hypothetical protein